jgi:alanyl-tRNA synthetase
MTKRLYWDEPYRREFTARIVDIVKDGIILDKTVFHPEGGNQAGDKGTLKKKSEIFEVDNTSSLNGDIIHHISSDLQGKLKIGDKIQGKIDWDYRYGHMKSHSSQHLLSAIFKREFDINTKKVKIRNDFVVLNLSRELTYSQLLNVLLTSNEFFVHKQLKIFQKLVPFEEAQNYKHKIRGTIPKKKEVRLVFTEEHDVTCCGGTHVKYSNEIGPILVYEFKNGKKLKYYTGKKAVEYIAKYNLDFLNLSEKFQIPLREVKERINSQIENSEKLKENNVSLKQKLLELVVKNPSLIKNDIKISYVTFPIEFDVLNVFFENLSEKILLILKLDNQVLKIITNYENVSAAEILDKLLNKFGGKGGGSSFIAQGKIEKFPDDILNVIGQMLH